MMDDLRRLLVPVRNRLNNLVARAIVTLVTDSTKLQSLQLGILAGETREACERFQEYGFTAVPLPGDDAGAPEAIVLFVGGHRDHPLVVAVDDRRWRKKSLQPGEVALYDDLGTCVLLKRGNELVLVASTKVTVTSPLVDCSQDVNVAGVYKVDGVQVVKERQGAITAPVGGGTVDAQARTAINDIRAALSAHGLTA